ncbi:hypothetical protein HD806DRAFT_21881 [Xylariaceae sp. AK1471]|nr:hypothetical protein HD806DRAFT_21881 [Xylariaceae sp. AK1471]
MMCAHHLGKPRTISLMTLSMCLLDFSLMTLLSFFTAHVSVWSYQGKQSQTTSFSWWDVYRSYNCICLFTCLVERSLESIVVRPDINSSLVAADALS